MHFDATQIQAGMVAEGHQKVTKELSASHLRSGNVEVLATPMMVLLVEKTCNAMVEHLLTPELVTVGTSITVHHLAPTPVGDDVRIRAEIIAVEENRIMYTATLWDSQEKIGEAEHTRVIVDRNRFLSRAQSKASLL